MKTNFGFPWRWFLGQSSKMTFTSSLSLLSKTMFSYRILFVIITFNLISSINAGPVYTRHRRMMREVYSELGMESYNNTQPDEGKCLLDGNQVLQATVVCNKKNGCRVIQKTGYCCPDYQCECERNGTIYENGKKLVDPENPCKVCYCKGGEISCNSVTCYERNDCVPKYIPGRCCPEYDNCPPLDELPPSSTVSKSVTILNQLSTSTPKIIPEIQNNPLGIKIKEITKAEEIRIIDEKPKIYSTVKPNGSSVTNQSKVFQINEKVKITSSTTEFPEFSSLDNENLNITNEKMNSEIEKPSSVIENVNALEIADINDTMNDENSSKIVRHTDQIAENLDVNSSTPDINLKPDLQQQGEKIVIVDGNGETKPILVHGVEGLQRGDDTGDEENMKEHNSDVTSESSNNDNPLNQVAEDELEPEAAGSELDVQVSISGPETFNKSVTEEVKSEVMNNMTTEGTIEDFKSSSTPGVIYETMLYTSGPEVSEDKEMTFETVYHEANESSISVSTKSVSSTSIAPVIAVDSDKQLHLHLNDDDTAHIDKSPEFPSIPDDLSIYGREVLTQAYAEDEPKNFQIKQVTEDPEVIELINPHNSSTESPISEKHNDINNEEPIDDETLLIPKWDNNSTQLINNNGTDNSTEDEWNNQVNFEVDPGSGSGLGQIIELSSPRPKNTIDIDDAIEASADTPIILSNEDTADTVVESEPVSHLFDPDSQMNHLKFLKAIDAFHNIRKSYLNFLNF